MAAMANASPNELSSIIGQLIQPHQFRGTPTKEYGSNRVRSKNDGDVRKDNTFTLKMIGMGSLADRQFFQVSL